MDIHKLDDTLSVSPQVTPEDVEQIAKAGFKTLISNRPEGEGADQPATDEIAEAARKHGLDWVHMPVVPGNITDADIAEFRQLLENSATPAFAFCRTGTRCTMLWAFANAQRDDIDALLRTASAAGYDLTQQRERMVTLANAR
ncbi:TIGR01244 family sulfur transferase [Marinobacter sp. 1Y8]